MKAINNFSNNLASLRKAKCMTQAQLAKALNVNQRTISAWENGICEPNINLLLELCELFDETLGGLILE